MKILLIVTFLFCTNLFAGTDHEHTPVKVSKNFETLKGLIGNWEGKNNMHGKEEVVKVSYELTSGGTAIVEKMMPGTPMEMVTVYANHGEDVSLTHFCAMGNQPQMKLKKSSGKTMEFEMEGTAGLTDANESHMHALKVTLNGNKLKQEWTNFKDNKKVDAATFEFKKLN